MNEPILNNSYCCTVALKRIFGGHWPGIQMSFCTRK